MEGVTNSVTRDVPDAHSITHNIHVQCMYACTCTCRYVYTMYMYMYTPHKKLCDNHKDHCQLDPTNSSFHMSILINVCVLLIASSSI